MTDDYNDLGLAQVVIRPSVRRSSLVAFLYHTWYLLYMFTCVTVFVRVNNYVQGQRNYNLGLSVALLNLYQGRCLGRRLFCKTLRLQLPSQEI